MLQIDLQRYYNISRAGPLVRVPDTVAVVEHVVRVLGALDCQHSRRGQCEPQNRTKLQLYSLSSRSVALRSSFGYSFVLLVVAYNLATDDLHPRMELE